MNSDYYLWLESLVNDGSHGTLIRFLTRVPYRWDFILDENRSAGGLNLRRSYAYNNGVSYQDICSGPCDVLEMLIALADRMTELIPGDIKDCFWILIRNLKLDIFDDNHFNERSINSILNVWLDRAYDPDGTGSLFPLKNYNGDCRTLTIWDQMNAWISENYPHSDAWLRE